MYVFPARALQLVHMEGIADGSLFRENVRYTLGNTAVNKSIRKALANKPGHASFILGHNGLIILCSSADNSEGGQLTIKAPNAKVPNVNADSPVNERINYYLQTEINPGLASHGGQVSLIDVVEDGIAVLKFGGGCQGCGQADVTLKEGIERTLLERIPELKGVRDVTDHTQKENAYY